MDTVATVIALPNGGVAQRTADFHALRTRVERCATALSPDAAWRPMQLVITEMCPRAVVEALLAPDRLTPSLGWRLPAALPRAAYAALLARTGHRHDAPVAQAVAALGPPSRAGVHTVRTDRRYFSDEDVEGFEWAWELSADDGNGAHLETAWALARRLDRDVLGPLQRPRVRICGQFGGGLRDPATGAVVAGGSLALSPWISLNDSRVDVALHWPGEVERSPGFALLWDTLQAHLGKLPTDAVGYETTYEDGRRGTRTALFRGTNTKLARPKAPKDPTPSAKLPKSTKFLRYDGTFALGDDVGQAAVVHLERLMTALTTSWRVRRAELIAYENAGPALLAAVAERVGCPAGDYLRSSPARSLAPAEMTALLAAHAHTHAPWVASITAALGTPQRAGWRCMVRSGDIDALRLGWLGDHDAIPTLVAALEDGVVQDLGGADTQQVRSAVRLQLTACVAGCDEPARAEAVIYPRARCFVSVTWPHPSVSKDAAVAAFVAEVEALTGRAPRSSGWQLAWRDVVHRLHTAPAK